MISRVFRRADPRRLLHLRRPSSAASAQAPFLLARSTHRTRPCSNLRSPLPRPTASLACSVSIAVLFARGVLFLTSKKQIMSLFRAPLAGRLTSPFAWTRPVWDTSLRPESKYSRTTRCRLKSNQALTPRFNRMIRIRRPVQCTTANHCRLAHELTPLGTCALRPD